jgi:hypothetical protein
MTRRRAAELFAWGDGHLVSACAEDATLYLRRNAKAAILLVDNDPSGLLRLIVAVQAPWP